MSTVLVIDDAWQDEGLDSRLRNLLEGISPGVALRFACDYFQARDLLAHPDTDVRVVLLDQRFDAAPCRLLDDALEEAPQPEARWRLSQGFRIARRIHRDDPLRPAILMFTSTEQDIPEAERLVREGVLEGYQGKPGDWSEAGQERAELAQFLRWHLNPVAALAKEEDLTGLDRAFGRFLADRIADWRRDAPAILQALAEVARERGGRLNLRSWTAARQRVLDAARSHAWDEERLWLRLLTPYAKGECVAWRPWGPPVGGGRERIRFFALNQDPQKRRIIAVFDPRCLPERTTSQRRQLARLPALTELDAGATFRLFRLPLPARCPGGNLPWLLCTWFDVVDGSGWITLAELRARAVDQRRPLRSALAEVFEVIIQGRDPQKMPTRGVLADTVLVNTQGARMTRAPWVIPSLPIDLLGLHPDPAEGTRGLPGNYVGRLETVADWLDILFAWFAWGEVPELPNTDASPRQFLDPMREVLFRLARQQAVDWDLACWWVDRDGPGRGRPRVPVPRDPIRLVNRTLEVRSELRCLGEAGVEPLRVQAKVEAIGCTFQVEAFQVEGRGDEVLPLFEQLAFQQPVVLRGCRMRDADGRPAPLILRDCLFLAGLDVNDLDALEVRLERCTFRSPTLALRLTGLALEGNLAANQVKIEGAAQIAATSSAELRFSGEIRELKLGSNVRIRERLQVTLSGSGKVLMEDVRTPGKVVLKLASGATLGAERCAWDDARLELEPGAGPVEWKTVRVNEGLNLVGQGDVVMDTCTIQGDILARGPALTLTGCRLERSLRVLGSLARLTMERTSVAGALGFVDRGQERDLGPVLLADVELSGGLHLSGVHMRGPFRLERGVLRAAFRAEKTSFESLIIASTSSVGELLFAGSTFRGAVCIGPRHGSGGPTPDLAGVVFREQIDFSGAHFKGEADFAYLVLEREAKFQNAVFEGPARFDGVQAGGHFVFADARFRGPVSFERVLVGGVLDLSAAAFAEPPSLVGGDCARGVRLTRVCWPLGHGAAADCSDCTFGGLLDVADPRGADGHALGDGADFWLELGGATLGSLNLGTAAMNRALDRGAARLGGGKPAETQRLVRLARQFEAALLRETRLDEADRFFRRANTLQGGLWRGFLDLLWGHGTLPLRVAGWIGAGALLSAFLTFLTFWVSGKGVHEVPQSAVDAWITMAMAQPPKLDALAWIFWGPACVLSLGQIILVNLFFAALARKLLR